MKSVKLFILSLSIIISASAQDTDEKNWRIYGYVKDMVSYNFSPYLIDNQADNLIHNRLNFSYYPTQKLNFQLEVRTRMFTGDLVKSINEYSSFIDVNNDYFDMSWVPVDNKGLVLHTMIDRAYVDWQEEKWTLRAGRQRINWGINMVWNPNDIFNAYNFFDFDYEERPGSDAIRFQRFIGYAGGFEIAVKAADTWNEVTGAFLYKWNTGGYDIQFLSGVMRDNWVLGTGWAGNIGLAGFKGEFSYFKEIEKQGADQLMGTLSFDYSFSNSLYLNVSGLYNSRGGSTQGLPLQSSANLDVRSLSPYKWSTFLQTSYNFHPLLSGGISFLYFVNQPGAFINPFITWSIVQNLDLDLIGQFYINGQPQEVNILFVRMKYSF